MVSRIRTTLLDFYCWVLFPATIKSLFLLALLIYHSQTENVNPYGHGSRFVYCRVFNDVAYLNPWDSQSSTNVEEMSTSKELLSLEANGSNYLTIFLCGSTKWLFKFYLRASEQGRGKGRGRERES